MSNHTSAPTLKKTPAPSIALKGPATNPCRGEGDGRGFAADACELVTGCAVTSRPLVCPEESGSLPTDRARNSRIWAEPTTVELMVLTSSTYRKGFHGRQRNPRSACQYLCSVSRPEGQARGSTWPCLCSDFVCSNCTTSIPRASRAMAGHGSAWRDSSVPSSRAFAISCRAYSSRSLRRSASTPSGVRPWVPYSRVSELPKSGNVLVTMPLMSCKWASPAALGSVLDMMGSGV